MTVEVGGLLSMVEYDYPQFHLTLHCYCCRVAKGSLTLKELTPIDFPLSHLGLNIIDKSLL